MRTVPGRPQPLLAVAVLEEVALSVVDFVATELVIHAGWEVVAFVYLGSDLDTFTAVVGVLAIFNPNSADRGGEHGGGHGQGQKRAGGKEHLGILVLTV